MGRPMSKRSAVAVLDFEVSVVLLIRLRSDSRRGLTKKPTAESEPWVFVEIFWLMTTRAPGAAYGDGQAQYQRRLSNVQSHGPKLNTATGRVKFSFSPRRIPLSQPQRPQKTHSPSPPEKAAAPLWKLKRKPFSVVLTKKAAQYRTNGRGTEKQRTKDKVELNKPKFSSVHDILCQKRV